MINSGFNWGRRVREPGSNKSVRVFARQCNRRASEASETLRLESIMLELVAYEPPGEPSQGGRLTFVILTDDSDRAGAVLVASTIPIDLCHRASSEGVQQRRVPLEVTVCRP